MFIQLFRGWTLSSVDMVAAVDSVCFFFSSSYLPHWIGKAVGFLFQLSSCIISFESIVLDGQFLKVPFRLQLFVSSPKYHSMQLISTLIYWWIRFKSWRNKIEKIGIQNQEIALWCSRRQCCIIKMQIFIAFLEIDWNCILPTSLNRPYFAFVIVI